MAGIENCWEEYNIKRIRKISDEEK